jgi:hypothetical protein
MALFAAGCGGGNSTTDESGSATATTSPTGEPTQPSQGQTAGGGDNRAPANQQQPQGLKPSDARSLPNEGTKAIAPGVPTTKGGDDSIQSYGVESNGDERVQAAGVLKAYLAAQLNRDWTSACALLALETRQDIERLWERAAGTKGGQACQKAMAGFLAGVPKGEIQALGELHVLSMRAEGDRGFIIYDDGNGRASESPMQLEQGHWRVRTLIAKELLLAPPTE